MKYDEIEIEKLVPHPANFPGREQKMDTEMLRSIEELGLLQPLTVREMESGDYQILAGHRRFTALQNVDQQIDHVPCIVKQLNDKEAIDFVVLENLQRCELDPMDEAYAVNLLMEQHGDSGEVADLLSRSVTWVSLRQGLLELGDDAQQMLRDRDLLIGTAAVILKVEPEDREQAEQLVLYPDFQVEPLNSIQAAEAVQTVILEPARRRAEWENKRESEAWAAKERFREWYGDRVSGVNIQSAKYEDVSLYQGGDFGDVEDPLPLAVLTEHVPEFLSVGSEGNDDQVDTLRYFDLAIRHGLPVVVIPHNEGWRAVVNKKILIDGEKSRMEHGLDPWIADAVSKAIDEECQEEAPSSIDDEGADALDKVETPEEEVDAIAKELEWFIEQSRESKMREKVDLGAAMNFVLGVSDDAPIGFEKLVPEDMSPGARKLVLKLLCWAQGVDFWK